jgi:hypothetical protein
MYLREKVSMSKRVRVVMKYLLVSVSVTVDERKVV